MTDDENYDDVFEYRGHRVVFDSPQLLIDGESYTSEFHMKIYSRDMVKDYIDREIEGTVPLSDYLDDS